MLLFNSIEILAAIDLISKWLNYLDGIIFVFICSLVISLKNGSITF